MPASSLVSLAGAESSTDVPLKPGNLPELSIDPEDTPKQQPIALVPLGSLKRKLAAIVSRDQQNKEHEVDDALVAADGNADPLNVEIPLVPSTAL